MYDELSDGQKKLVDNEKDLVAAVEQLSVLQIENVESKIFSIGKITLNSREKIINICGMDWMRSLPLHCMLSWRCPGNCRQMINL